MGYMGYVGGMIYGKNTVRGLVFLAVGYGKNTVLYVVWYVDSMVRWYGVVDILYGQTPSVCGMVSLAVCGTGKRQYVVRHVGGMVRWYRTMVPCRGYII